MKRNGGFTLIELLVVVSIIGVLSSTVMAGVMSAREKANIASGIVFADHLRQTMISSADYPFDQVTSGTTPDSSGYGNTCTLVGPPVTVAGVINNALSFDGTDYLTCGTNGLVLTNKFTISLWVLAPTPSDMVVLSADGIGSDTSGAYNIYIQNSGAISYESNNIGSITTGASAITFGKWQNVSITYNNPTITIYINGKIVTEGSVSAPSTIGTSLLVGRRGVVSFWNFFQGSMDNLRIYNQVLNASEIEKIYAEGSAQHMVSI